MFNKQLGQHFLGDESIAEEIAGILPVSSKKVLEIGAGGGILTLKLAAKASKVTAVEIDETLKPRLEEALAGVGNVSLVFEDALKMDFSGYGAVFGNLPYYIASPLLFKIIDAKVPAAVLMLQLEMAYRLVAEPDSSDYSRLTVMVQADYDCDLYGIVTRDKFVPAPRVDSAVVVMKLKPASKRVALDKVFVRAIFEHKNQSLRNALKHSSHELQFDKKKLVEFADSLGSVAQKRARALSLQELAGASESFEKFRK